MFVLGAVAVLLPSGVCSRADCSALPKTLTAGICCRERGSYTEREILQEIGRELGIIACANGHEGEQAVIDALSGRKRGDSKLQRLCAVWHAARFFLLLLLFPLYPSPLTLGPSVESEGGLGIWGGGRNYSRNVLFLPPKRVLCLV